MYFNDETVIYLNGKFVKVTEYWNNQSPLIVYSISTNLS